MGGFIGGVRDRQPGIMIMCNRCKEEKPESSYYFNYSNGYSSYCNICERERTMETRMRRKERLNNIEGDAPVKSPRNRAILETPDHARLYSDKIKEIAKATRIGEVIQTKKRKGKIVDITPYFAVVEYKHGVKECFIWDDLARIKAGVYVGDTDDE